MKKQMLSIVIPVYNEQGSIEVLLKEYEKSGKGYNFELVCVNNGSTDATEKILHENKKKYPFVQIVTVKKNIGYGYGIMTGVRSTRGEVVAWTHADMQTPASDVFRAFDLYKKANNIKTIVKGKRGKRPFADTVVSFGMGLIASIFLRVSLSEINAQPKLFHHSFIPYLKKTPDDFSLDLFFLYTAKKRKYTILTIPVKFHFRKHGKSKWAYSFRSRIHMIGKTLQYIFKLSLTQ